MVKNGSRLVSACLLACLSTLPACLLQIVLFSFLSLSRLTASSSSSFFLTTLSYLGSSTLMLFLTRLCSCIFGGRGSCSVSGSGGEGEGEGEMR